MGTTMTYIQLKNRGFTKEELRERLRALAGGGKAEEGAMARNMAALKGEKLSLKDRMVLKLLQGVMRSEDRLQAAFRPDAAWLPFYQTRLCDGRILSSADLGQLSQAFRTPVLSFAVFDSDVLFVSYRDSETGELFDYAKPNWEEYEEYDAETYRLGFPEFLAGLCPPGGAEKLRDIWDAEEDFAEDRMGKILEVLGTDFIDPEAECFPKGFEPVVP